MAIKSPPPNTVYSIHNFVYGDWSRGVQWIRGEVYVGTLCQRVSGAEGMALVGI